MGIQGLHSALAPLVLRRAAVKEVARLLREAAPEQGAPGADTEPTGCQEVAAEDHTGDAAPDRDGLPAPSKRSAGTVAVDGFSWLHKGAYGSALQVARGSPAPGVIKYCMRRVAALRDAGLEPLVVFDGARVPMKLAMDRSRKDRRDRMRSHGLQLLAASDREPKGSERRTQLFSQAMDRLQRAVSVPPYLVTELQAALRRQGVRFVVAPFEADAQLVHLVNTGAVGGIVTEDSDIVTYLIGTTRLGVPVPVLFKLDEMGAADVLWVDAPRRLWARACEAAEASTLTRHPEQSGPCVDAFCKELRHFTRRMFVQGCDYLASLPRIGFKTAAKLILRFRSCDDRNRVRRVLYHLQYRASTRTEVPASYETTFHRAEATFYHHRVWSPDNGSVVELTPLPDPPVLPTRTPPDSGDELGGASPGDGMVGSSPPKGEEANEHDTSATTAPAAPAAPAAPERPTKVHTQPTITPAGTLALRPTPGGVGGGDDGGAGAAAALPTAKAEGASGSTKRRRTRAGAARRQAAPPAEDDGASSVDIPSESDDASDGGGEAAGGGRPRALPRRKRPRRGEEPAPPSDGEGGETTTTKASEAPERETSTPRPSPIAAMFAAIAERTPTAPSARSNGKRARSAASGSPSASLSSGDVLVFDARASGGSGGMVVVPAENVIPNWDEILGVPHEDNRAASVARGESNPATGSPLKAARPTTMMATLGLDADRGTGGGGSHSGGACSAFVLPSSPSRRSRSATTASAAAGLAAAGSGLDFTGVEGSTGQLATHGGDFTGVDVDMDDSAAAVDSFVPPDESTPRARAPTKPQVILDDVAELLPTQADTEGQDAGAEQRRVAQSAAARRATGGSGSRRSNPFAVINAVSGAGTGVARSSGSMRTPLGQGVRVQASALDVLSRGRGADGDVSDGDTDGMDDGGTEQSKAAGGVQQAEATPGSAQAPDPSSAVRATPLSGALKPIATDRGRLKAAGIRLKGSIKQTSLGAFFAK